MTTFTAHDKDTPDLLSPNAYMDLLLERQREYRYVPQGIEGTLVALYQAGLPVEHIADAARIAGSNSGVIDRAAYFAGICWKRVRRMHEIAEGIVAEGSTDGE